MNNKAQNPTYPEGHKRVVSQSSSREAHLLIRGSLKMFQLVLYFLALDEQPYNTTMV